MFQDLRLSFHPQKGSRGFPTVVNIAFQVKEREEGEMEEKEKEEEEMEEEKEEEKEERKE